MDPTAFPASRRPRTGRPCLPAGRKRSKPSARDSRTARRALPRRRGCRPAVTATCSRCAGSTSASMRWTDRRRRMAMTEPADRGERDAALDVRRSFIVQAPAGSGKTELLVQRYLRLLDTVEKPEEILAITFTKKAAAEMRKRVLERLPNSGEIAHRLRIQTIDAFCTALTRQVPVLARFGAQPEIIEDASELYREAAARVFKEFNPASEKLLAHLDNDIPKATRLLADRLKDRDRWLRKTGAAPTRSELEAAMQSERTRLLEKAKALFPKATEALARGVLRKDGEWLQR